MELIKKDVINVVPDESLKFLNDVLSKRIKASDNIKESEYLLRIGTVNKFSKGNISGWIGLAKSKKV